MKTDNKNITQVQKRKFINQTLPIKEERKTDIRHVNSKTDQLQPNNESEIFLKNKKKLSDLRFYALFLFVYMKDCHLEALGD